MDLKRFAQAEVDDQTDNCHVEVTYRDKQIECRGETMTRDEWVDFGKDIAYEVMRKFNKEYYVSFASPNSFTLCFSRNLEGGEKFI